MTGATIFSGYNLHYLEALEQRFQVSPEELDTHWRLLFEAISALDQCAGGHRADEGAAIFAETIRLRGHRFASLDPLGEPISDPATKLSSELTANVGDPARLISTYCSSLTVECAHIDDPDQRRWLMRAIEAPTSLTEKDRLSILDDLIRADGFERFLRLRYPTKKRFGAEGAETLVPLLQRILQTAAGLGVTHAVIATMHRGRFNILANVLGKPLTEILAEFNGKHPFPLDDARPADVSYHLGYAGEVATPHGPIGITLTPNPSHLEAVNAVGLGRARALQDLVGAQGRSRVLPIVLHTDASVVGQGVVAELLQMSGVSGFDVGGTLHVVINNQIGFTTNPTDARTSTYCTGPWKAIDSAILHVNGDEPEQALRAADIALAFRREHGRDAVIDLVCYRRNGHNEIDEPSFTQPDLYATIQTHPSVLESYSQRLIGEGIVSQDQVEKSSIEFFARLDEAYHAADEYSHGRSGYRRPSVPCADATSGVPADQLRRLASLLASTPEGFELHPRIARVRSTYDLDQHGTIGWPLAEALAIGSLLCQGIDVRLTGQDVTRGAFSHRHFRVFDQRTGQAHFAFDHLTPCGGKFSLFDSPLSEYAVLGFEYGYSLEKYEALTVWEAQFGDFANGAQIVVDQFIVSGEDKWCSASGLVLLLPHGLDGQGPEHSSARIERYLQLAAGANVRICQPTTSANYFHMLRRQALFGPRKPLIVCAPKKLLRDPAAVSAVTDFLPGRQFLPLIVNMPNGPVENLVLCSGKIAYPLDEALSARGASGVAVVRFEQIYPFPKKELLEVVRACPHAKITWVQEEPENMGAWRYVELQLRSLEEAADAPLSAVYAGRPEATSPAGSFHTAHEADQSTIIDNLVERLVIGHRRKARSG